MICVIIALGIHNGIFGNHIMQMPHNIISMIPKHKNAKLIAPIFIFIVIDLIFQIIFSSLFRPYISPRQISPCKRSVLAVLNLQTL